MRLAAITTSAETPTTVKKVINVSSLMPQAPESRDRREIRIPID